MRLAIKLGLSVGAKELSPYLRCPSGAARTARAQVTSHVMSTTTRRRYVRPGRRRLASSHTVLFLPLLKPGPGARSFTLVLLVTSVSLRGRVLYDIHVV